MSLKRQFAELDPNVSEALWTKCYSHNHNCTYWSNSKTNVTVWTDPTECDGPVNSTSPSSSAAAIPSIWTKHRSVKHNCDYWYNATTDKTSWVDPGDTGVELVEPKRDDTHIKEAAEKASRERISMLLQREGTAAAVGFPECPRVINSTDLPALVKRLHVVTVTKKTDNPDFQIIFVLPNDELADITRAVQEDQILKTRLKVRKGGKVVDLPSFWEVWQQQKLLSKVILASTDPNEEKWRCRQEFGYKIATTFMPPYAKSIYEHFNAQSVLDPCAGWGDRLIGAAASSCVKKYVCFDPNRSLRPGYAKLMELFGHSAIKLDDEHIHFSNSFQCHAQPFESGALELDSESFDLVFTSPPFFEYEMYTPSNPKYTNWLEEFYTPLFIQACRCVKYGGHVCIHIGDTSAGVIEPFLKENVHLICDLRLIHKIGLEGLMSGETRTVWVFKKFYSTVLAPLSRSRICALSNPPVRVLKIGNNSKSFQVFDDGRCIGGTKQRLLGRLLQSIDAEEVVYAGPDGGIAQVALAYAAALCNKKAVIFLNTYCRGVKPQLVQLAESLGAVVHFPDPESRGRTLEETETAARAYAYADSKRHLLPFGLRGKPGEPNFELFKEALLDCLQGASAPSRLWLVAGSGFLMDVLHSIWPETKYMVVQVGRRIWPDQLENKHHELFIAPEGFGERALLQPPYSTVPWYDAKLWQFAVENWKENDCIWNVGSVPANPFEAAQEILKYIKESS